MWHIKKDRDFGIIDKNGQVIIEFGYDVLSKVGDKKLLKASTLSTEKETTIIYSEKLEKLCELTNAKIMMLDDYILLYNEEEEIFITNNGEVKKAKEILSDNKLFAVQKTGKWGFEDKSGNVKVEPEYNTVTEFNRFGFAGIKKDGKWGIINDSGDIIVECKFEFSESVDSPEFLGKYYRTYKENNEIYYSDVVSGLEGEE